LLNVDGGAGRDGRVRVDAVAIVGSLGPAHRGVMFDATVAAITRTATPAIRVLGSSGDQFDIHRASTSYVSLAQKAIDFGGATELDESPPALSPGFNRVCIVPAGSGLGHAESRNCVDIAYLP
jgi:hypothetical protein